MSPYAQKIATALATHPRWVWTVGLMAYRINAFGEIDRCRVGNLCQASMFAAGWVPDLEDIGTTGALLYLVGETPRGRDLDAWRVAWACGGPAGVALGVALLEAWTAQEEST